MNLKIRLALMNFLEYGEPILLRWDVIWAI